MRACNTRDLGNLKNHLIMHHTNRREFLKKLLSGGAAIASVGCPPFLCQQGLSMFSPGASGKAPGSSFNKINLPDMEAMYYRQLAGNRVRCELCHQNCTISNRRRGNCKNRENRQGKLYSLVYSRPSAINIDPIEKEPQHHMLPGQQMICVGTAGCNFRCRHCHNWHLSQRSIEEIGTHFHYTPADIVQAAKENGLPAISATYNEPTVFYEYVLDIAKLAQKEGIRILWHSNAYMHTEPLKELLKYTDSVTIDLKGFSQQAYENSAGKLEPVLNNLKTIHKSGVWLEVVNLIIPTINDSVEEIKAMCQWVKQELSPEVPLHFSRFFPSYKLTQISPTPLETLEKAHDIARKAGLHYVTLGNVPGHRLNSTFCPECDKVLIRRVHFTVTENNIRNGSCAECNHPIPGIWN